MKSQEIHFGAVNVRMDKLPLISAILPRICPIMLAAVIMNAYLFVYTEMYISGWGVFSAVFMTGCYILFCELKKRKIAGGFIYGGMLAFVGLASGMIIQSGPDYGARFMTWFISGTLFEETHITYIMAFTLGFSFIIISVVFYFTEAIYRKQWLLVVSLIPFTAYAKMLLTPPMGYIVLIAAFQLFIYLQKTRESMQDTAFMAGSRSVLTVYGDFAIALVILIAIIPKPSVTPYWEQFEEVLSNFTIGRLENDDFGSDGISKHSGNANDQNRGERRLLYNIAMSEHNYLKMQTFPYYDPDENYWYTNEYSYMPEWGENNDLLNLGMLATAILEASENDPGLLAGYGLERDRQWLTLAAENHVPHIPDEDGSDLDPVCNLYVEPVNYASIFAVAPNRPLDTTLAAEHNVMELYGGGIVGRRPFPADEGYSFLYRSDTAPIWSGYLDTALANLSYKDYENFLVDVIEKLPIGADGRLSVKAYHEQHILAMNWTEYITYQNEQIKNLANDITAGLDTAYDKAHALEQYFYTDGFTYFLGYVSPVNTSEYFLFDSKMGTCSDFATAYALLAGTQGLAVRYTEGYVPIPVTAETNEPGVTVDLTLPEYMDFYYVTTDNAHAYPEVYINGAWVRFEPTVSNTLMTGTPSTGAAAAIDTATVLAYVIGIVTLIILAVVFILLLPTIREAGFRLSLRLRLLIKKGRQKPVLIALYRRVLHITGKEKATPSEFYDYVLVKRGFDTSPITKPLEESVFGDKEVSKKTVAGAFKTYKKFYRIRRGKKT